MVASAVSAELDRSGRSPDWLSERTALELSELQSKLDLRSDFTVTDLAAIAAALSVPVATLVPAPVAHDPAAEALNRPGR